MTQLSKLLFPTGKVKMESFAFHLQSHLMEISIWLVSDVCVDV